MVEVKFLGDGYKKKDEKKKKRAWRKKVKKNLIPSVVISDFTHAVESLTKSSATGLMNCFARYFIERVFDEIRILNRQGNPTTPAKENAGHVLHKLPMRELRFFPLYNTGNPEIHESLSPSAAKQSFLIIKMHALAPQFATHIDNEISKKMRIPLPSLACMLSVMVNRPCDTWFDPIGSSTELTGVGARIVSAQNCDYVFIPDDIPPDKRDDRVIEASQKLYNLLIEAFIVIMLAGWSDLVDIRNRKNQGTNISALKGQVREMACCTWLETQLTKIISVEELEECISKEFSFFEEVYAPIQLYLMNRIYKSEARYANRLKPDDPPVESAAYEAFTHGMKPETVEVLKKLAHPPKDIGLQPPKKSASQYRVWDFLTEVSHLATKKLLNRPWKKYKLDGNVSNIANYIHVVIFNCFEQCVEDDLGTVPGLNIAFRSYRRYNSEIQAGVHDEFLKKINKLGIQNIRDLSEEEYDDFKEYKADREEHIKKGSITQNKLIEYLRDEKEIATLNKKGIFLKKNSVPTLRKKLKILNEAGKIKHETDDKGTYYYKEEDKEQIAQALANLIRKP